MENEINIETPHILSFEEIRKAADRIDGAVIHTPLCEAKISKYMDYKIYLKCENLQYTGSCAERGIRNAFMSGDDFRERKVVVPSNGNLALGAAYHGNSLGIPVTVVVPNRTPPATAQRCSELGADVILCGENRDEAVAFARKATADTDDLLLSSDEPSVMAGLGTVGLEVVVQLPEVDAVIVPVASGGLLASVLVACKKLKCSCLVYGAECAKVPKMMKALQAGRPVPVLTTPNLADGLSHSSVGPNAFATLKGRLDRMLVVDESWVARAVVSVLEGERLVADGAGVCAVAAVMQGLVPELRGKRAVCVISGGNIEPGRLARVIQRGLGASSRLLRFAVPMPDHRSGLEALAKVISDENAVLKSLVTDQMWVQNDVSVTWVFMSSCVLDDLADLMTYFGDLKLPDGTPKLKEANVVVETANEEHAKNIKDHLRDTYPNARFALDDISERHRTSVH